MSDGEDERPCTTSDPRKPHQAESGRRVELGLFQEKPNLNVSTIESAPGASERCSTCLRALEKIDASEMLDGIERGITPLELHQSAEAGCASCSILWAAVNYFYNRKGRLPNAVAAAVRGSSMSLTGDYWEGTEPSCVTTATRSFSFHYLEPGLPYELGPFKFTNNPGSLAYSTSSVNTWKVCKAWLDDCQRQHEKCRLPPSSYLPKRLVDVGENSTDDADVKLLEPAPGHTGTYACLSHCWGPKGCNLRTVLSNLDQHKRRISFKSLPRIFADSVRFTRWLGLRFIWIDSLCIIQDSTEDWAQEAKRMGLIYENAFITLSAVSASSGDQALFSGSQRGAWVHALSTNILKPGPYAIWPRQFHPSTQDFRTHLIGDDAGSLFPLMTRAWAYQERLLSPRVLYFGRNELYWACRTGTQCECHLEQASDFENQLGPSTSWNQLLNSTGPTKASETLQTWASMVTAYSRLRLTFESDRLPAIAGLAQRIASYLPEYRYLSGIWDRDPTALLWYVDTDIIHQLKWGGGDSIEHQMQSIGFTSSARSPPSWSWISVSGVIYLQSKEMMPFCTIVGHDCTAVNGEEFTTKAAKEITIEGPLEAWHHKPRRSPPDCSLGGGWVECSFGTGMEREMCLEFYLTLDRFTTVKESNLYLLRLAQCLPSKGSSAATSYFLLLELLEDPLQRSSTQRPARYRRLGLLILEEYQMDEDCGLGQTVFTKTERITLV